MTADLAKAQTSLQQALKLYPSHPEAHYELALVLSNRGETAQAREHLEAALSVWAQADPEDGLVAEARALESKLALR
jgi:Tfp pilus assembly protein PilF